MTVKKLLQVSVADYQRLQQALQEALCGRAVLAPVSAECEPLTAAQIAQIHPETAVIIRTSGSTGVPKAVELSAEALLNNAKAAHLALGGAGQWLVALPLSSMGGLGQLVRSQVSGIEPVFAAGMGAAEIMQSAALLTHSRRYVSLVPVQLQRLLELADVDTNVLEILRGFAAILVGGGAVSLELRQRAWELGLNLVRTYGATETAGGCVYDGVEIGDTKIRVRDGEVQLAGSNLALGYLGEAALSAATFITEFVKDSGEQPERWYRTGDTGRLLGGMLEITGRQDRVFISGGVNVSLDRIEAVLAKKLPDIELCAVAVPNREWGQRAIIAYRAPQKTISAADLFVHTSAGEGSQTGLTLSRAATKKLEAFLVAELGKAAKPIAFVGLEDFPRLTTGKVDLRSLTAALTTFSANAVS